MSSEGAPHAPVTLPEGGVVSDEIAATPPVNRVLAAVVTAVAVAMSLYHMYVAGFGPPEAVIFRGTHLLFALTLVYLLYPFRGGRSRAGRVLDFALLAAGWGFILHIFLGYDAFINRIIYIDELTVWDTVFAVLCVVVVLDGTRRVIGWALPITAILFLVYAVFFTFVKIPVLLEQLYLSTEGVFGSTLGVSASYVMLFVLFGAFMEKSGTGQLFMDFAMSITGHTAGGPGKVAIVSSSLFGTVSGSAVANVMVDGPITIPLMKRTGFRAPFAAAVESVASTGGQIMPPVMGAAAFVMAEFLAVPYSQVAMWALVPAVLYYVSLFFAVHFEAKRHGLAGVPRSQLPRLAAVMLARGHLFIPILVVLFGLMLGYSAPLSALVAAITCIPLALLRATTRAGIQWRSVLDALVDGARNTLAVAMACACAGLVIGVVTITGLGITFTEVVVGLSRESLLLALVLTAMAGIVLGMGMPTTPAYIVMVSLLVPALIKLGAATPAAHMFAFYFAVLSAITPPVALAVFAAAGLAKADMWQSGWEALRIAAPTYIVPFMFVYSPSLLLIGDWTQSLLAFASATIGVMCFASAQQGYLVGRNARLWERLVLFAAAFLLIKPGSVTDAIGLALLAGVYLSNRFLLAPPPVAARLPEKSPENLPEKAAE
ncbi:MAG: C4-dicarboxylate transporter permease [Ramlibacter sp.]|nr:C4-dicarboxylate transporter permease [Ramlibacter sp.]MCE3272409.1 C4-dicarboxylate transporter permease [Ramlibacter sp.]